MSVVSCDVCLSAVSLTRSAGPSRDSSHRFSMLPNSFEERQDEISKMGSDVVYGMMRCDVMTADMMIGGRREEYCLLNGSQQRGRIG
jgi:hypothetical protein